MTTRHLRGGPVRKQAQAVVACRSWAALFAGLLLALAASGTASAQSRVEVGVMPGVHGCEVAFEHHVPASPDGGPTVVLAHGFQRDLSTMRGWAQAWSAQGVPVVIPSLCNSSWFAGRHDRNANDLRALRRHLELGPVVYAGFSAGGLAAYLAAHDDIETVAYLGFDAVDSGDLATGRGGGLSVPALFLLAEPSACNADGNFRPVLERYDADAVHPIADATHCHFEWPFDPWCGWICGRRDEAQTQRIQAEIRDAAARFLSEVRRTPR